MGPVQGPHVLFGRRQARASDDLGVFLRIRLEQLAEGVALQIARLDIEPRGDGLWMIQTNPGSVLLGTATRVLRQDR